MKKILAKIFDLILPPICLTCDEKVRKYGDICYNCFNKFHFVTEPKCKICDLPLQNLYFQSLCDDCTNLTPHFNKLISLIVYNDFSHQIILNLKFNDKPNAAFYLSHLLAKKVRSEFAFDIIAPIPISKHRLRERKFNQSILIAKVISKTDKKPLIPNLLIKNPLTKKQTGLNRNLRKANIKNAFSVNTKYNIQNKTILLVDDVATTYATLDEAARILKKSGAKAVFCATLCRTPKTTQE